MIFVEYAESQNCAVARERTPTTTVVRAQFTNLMRHVWVEFFGSTCSCSLRLTKVFLISIYIYKKLKIPNRLEKTQEELLYTCA